MYPVRQSFNLLLMQGLLDQLRLNKISVVQSTHSALFCDQQGFKNDRLLNRSHTSHKVKDLILAS